MGYIVPPRKMDLCMSGKLGIENFHFIVAGSIPSQAFASLEFSRFLWVGKTLFCQSYLNLFFASFGHKNDCTIASDKSQLTQLSVLLNHRRKRHFFPADNDPPIYIHQQFRVKPKLILDR